MKAIVRLIAFALLVFAGVGGVQASAEMPVFNEHGIEVTTVTDLSLAPESVNTTDSAKLSIRYGGINPPANVVSSMYKAEVAPNGNNFVLTVYTAKQCTAGRSIVETIPLDTPILVVSSPAGVGWVRINVTFSLKDFANNVVPDLSLSYDAANRNTLDCEAASSWSVANKSETTIAGHYGTRFTHLDGAYPHAIISGGPQVIRFVVATDVSPPCIAPSSTGVNVGRFTVSGITQLEYGLRTNSKITLEVVGDTLKVHAIPNGTLTCDAGYGTPYTDPDWIFDDSFS